MPLDRCISSINLLKYSEDAEEKDFDVFWTIVTLDETVVSWFSTVVVAKDELRKGAIVVWRNEGSVDFV